MDWCCGWVIAGWVCGPGVFVLCMYVSQCMCISLYFCLGTYLSVCVSEWWSMYASHSCPSLSVFLPLWGLHVIFSISGLQARKHIHILHLHALQPPLRLVVGLDGFRWVQIGYWVLVLGGFHKYWLFLFWCVCIHWFWAGLRYNPFHFPSYIRIGRGSIPSLCSLDIENSVLVGQWYFPNWWKKIHHTYIKENIIVT